MNHPILEHLKNVNWRVLLTTVGQVLMDLRVAGTLLFFGFIIYGIGYDTVWRPNIESLKALDDNIQKQAVVMDTEKSKQQQYTTWARALEGLKTTIVTLSKDEVPTVVAAGEMARIDAILNGKNRNASSIEPLPAPHDRVQKADIKQTGMKEITLGEKPEGEQKAPPPAELVGGDKPADFGPEQQQAAVKLLRYDYEARVTGTLAALADIVNQLVLEDRLVVIREMGFQNQLVDDIRQPVGFGRPSGRDS